MRANTTWGALAALGLLGGLLVSVGLHTGPSAWGLGQVHAQEGPQALADCAGTWEGQVTFTNGWRGRVVADLEPTGQGTWAGDYQLTILDEEGGGQPTRGAMEVLPRPDGSLDLQLHGRQELRFTGHPRDAGSHAEAAICGVFDADDTHGVFMLWRYRQ
jgi:hypothetical protein